MRNQNSSNDLGGNDLVITESPRLHADKSNRSISNPSYLKVFTGNTEKECEKAHRTYLNELGPG